MLGHAREHFQGYDPSDDRAADRLRFVGAPTFNIAPAYGGNAAPGASVTPAGVKDGTHTAFLVWVVLIGVVLPIAILGGLKMGGFSFVFKGRG